MEENMINLESITNGAAEAESAQEPVKQETATEAESAPAAESAAPAEQESAEAEAQKPAENVEIGAKEAEIQPEANGDEAVPAEAEKASETAGNEPGIEDEDVPVEPVVAADAGEIEREEKREEPAPKRENTAPARQAARAAAPRKVREIDEVGTKSGEIEAEEALIKSDKEILDETYRDLVRAQRTGEYLMGEVFMVEPESDAFKNHAVIDVLYNGVKVMIPDTVYFEDTYDFGSTYATLSERKKTARRAVAARYQTGAKVYFVVSAVSREEVTLPSGEKRSVVIAVGDRKTAMAKVRDTYFFHRNRTSERRAPRNVAAGDLARAHVLAVREDVALVECLGVETRIDAFNLTDEKIIENCQDYTRPGDTLRVRIRKLHVEAHDDNPKADRVYLTVSGRLNESTDALLTMRQRTYVAGTVEFYNRDKDLYTIKLKNGVTAVVRAADVRGEIDLNPGDRVNVFVTAILEKYVVGRAAKA